MLLMKRILLIILLIFLLLLAVAPAAAQIPVPIDWIPAEFTGFVRLDVEDPQFTLNDLNLSLFVASVLQPIRFQFTEAQGYDTFFPLDSFDMENASFTETVLPWLKDEIIVAYRQLGAQFNADAEETLMILPSHDGFMSATVLQAVIAAQDLGERETYRDVIIYRGDKTSFAFLPTAVLVGADELIHATLDTMSGEHEALTASPVYQQVSASMPESPLISAYISEETAARALGVLLSGSDAADPFLGALNQLLVEQDDNRSPERLLLSGSVDGIGVSVYYDPVTSTSLEADVVLHTTETPNIEDVSFDQAVLTLIPRSAMLVQSGADASSTATGALYSIPFFNFASQALASFPILQTTGAVLPTPTAEDAEQAVNNFLDTVQPLVDVQTDLLEQFDGSYSLALLPRPNNPIPGTNIPFDLLLVVQTDSTESAETAQASASTLLETFAAPLDDEALDEHTFQTLRTADTGETLVSIGAVDNLLIIGTGSAAQQALDAQRGDNQLIQQERWQNLSADDQIPYVYVDVNAYYNTFLPSIGGPAVRPVSQLGVQSSYLGDNLFQLHLLVALTQ